MLTHLIGYPSPFTNFPHLSKRGLEEREPDFPKNAGCGAHCQHEPPGPRWAISRLHHVKPPREVGRSRVFLLPPGRWWARHLARSCPRVVCWADAGCEDGSARPSSRALPKLEASRCFQKQSLLRWGCPQEPQELGFPSTPGELPLLHGNAPVRLAMECLQRMAVL